MDDRHSAMLWQLMQSLTSSTQDGQMHQAEPPTFEHTLLSLRPLMSTRQQRIIDLMIKMQEIQSLMYELQTQP